MRKHNLLHLASPITLFGLFLSAVLLLYSQNPAHADTVTFTINPTGYYLNLTASPELAINLSPSSNGTIAAAKDTLSVATNIPGGYKLYLAMTSSTADSNKLYKNGDNTKAFNPTTGTISNPVALENNTWGYAIPNTTTGLPTNNFDSTYSNSTPSSTSKWAGVPVKGSDALIRTTTSPSPTAAPSTMDIYYGAKADLTLPSGTYSNTLTYSTVAEASQEVAGAASVSPSTTSNLAGGDTITIATSLYTQMDVGNVNVTIGGTECTNPTTSIVNNAVTITCTTPAKTAGTYDVVVTIPKFSKTYTIADGLKYNKPSFGNAEYMQNMTTAICNSVSVGTEGTLIDNRDNKEYTVAKLADGKCWMTSNLRLGNEAGGESITLTSADSDVTSTFTLPAHTSGAWASDTTDQAGADSAKMYSNGNSWLSGDLSGTTDMTVQTTGTPDTPSRYIGNYYNWYTATAGTGLYNNTTTNATSSICPKGWHLPTSGASGEFQALYTAYGSNVNTFKSSAPWVLSGYYNYAGSVYYQGSGGLWWSSTPSSSAVGAYYLGVVTTSVGPQYNYHKVNGLSVRCVAK